MGRTEVTLDMSGLAKVMGSADVRALLDETAETITSVARASAPVESGTYKDSIHTEPETTNWGWARARVVADAPHAHLVEARTGNLARALGSVGG